MKITIVTVGKIKEKYLTAGIQEYLKRLTPHCRLDIVELNEERMPDNPSPAEKAQAISREGERIQKSIRPGTHLIVLDVAGQMLSSEQLAAKFDTLALAGQSDLTFVIGGAFGLSPDVLAAAKERLSFSRMTFTHQMIRLLLVEQIYRAFKISRGEPYHW
ncbi:MAG TPA: 23S rRNA (pseudouridine(1915)-N(3))-methyltransferase RlmH [Methylomusa anaerophila]|uniref:Ribosomal RNA large subunit methyltransferase H n=1 Tax=Methylomusa anaerophila TaxID=1930071 RepID=A0A348AGN1_9FIRM|nr:23S rRNA (pseudouridine(1915)-N(3))-methyltransferase RlmH [Methylomusa anaerophila]BBB90229.1 ribosomal RNA large subunit methyltransferase H [Methylomusa anaerophila]HML89423.1 23S rRNA (pseudouridine(1915)-N(3))-methyltransferase RlmH [Methylomusa anaerophila]